MPLPFAALCRLAERSIRFGAHDPFLTAARAAGVARWGPTLSALVHASALRWPGRVAVHDDVGSVFYRRLDRQATALAAYLRAEGAGPVGLLCRNHRGFPLALLALERSGRDVAMLNTALPSDRLAAIVERDGLGLLISDTEFSERLDQDELGLPILPADPALLDSWSRPGVVRRPRRRSDIIMLTSGTTGPPKGARRSSQTPSIGSAALLDALPMRMTETTLIASPLFHAWGLAQATMALATGSTMVVQSRFDAHSTIEAIQRHRVTKLVVVPLMLARVLRASDPGTRFPHLEAVLCSGNVLSATLADQWIDRFGPNLYNIYGSTESAIASVATPQDLLDAPGTVGRPPRGVQIRILDDDDRSMPPGELGRVFTANDLQFDGYTDGTDRTRSGRYMATGDLGYLDESGRLFVDGRENDLIVTGGENVFPARIEEILELHHDVEQAAVVGLADDEYGQRVVAFLVATEDLDLDELDSWARNHLASFQRPREYRLVDALPMTTTGKVIRHSLTTLGLAEHP